MATIYLHYIAIKSGTWASKHERDAGAYIWDICKLSEKYIGGEFEENVLGL